MPPAAPPAAPARAATLDRVDLHDPVFISDLHLNPGQPLTLAAFHHFVRSVAPRFKELVILGDLFEYWAGDDDNDALAAEVGGALAMLAGQGLAVYLMHGNRDLLMGAEFCARARATLLADPTLAQIGETRVLLAHGDAYCTEDVDYMRFRAQVRNPDFQAMFLAKPLAERKAFIGQARAASEAGKASKAMDIMDVTPQAIEAAFKASGAVQMIHGHTHRPALHRMMIDGRKVERWVLPDWDFDATPARGGYLSRVDGQWQTRPARLPA